MGEARTSLIRSAPQAMETLRDKSRSAEIGLPSMIESTSVSVICCSSTVIPERSTIYCFLHQLPYLFGWIIV